MSRSCGVCAQQEKLIEINSRIAAREPLAALAREFSVSQDAMQRHAKRHLRREEAKPENHQDRNRTRLEKALNHAEALADQCARTNDTRGLADALQRIDSLSASLVKLDVQVSSSFESLDLRGKARYVKSDGELYRLILDDLLHSYPDLIVRGTNANSDSRGQSSVQ